MSCPLCFIVGDGGLLFGGESGVPGYLRGS